MHKVRRKVRHREQLFARRGLDAAALGRAGMRGGALCRAEAQERIHEIA